MIKAYSVISEIDSLEGMKLHVRYSLGKRLTGTFYSGIIVLALALLNFVRNDFDLVTKILAGIGICLLFSPFWTKRFLLSSFKKNLQNLPNLGQTIT